MAIVKIKTAKRDIKGIIDYVTNPNKTNELLITGKDCSPETVVDEMEVVKEQHHKKDGTTYFHVIQSFSPNDNITPEKAHEVGVNFADYFKNYQVLIATHIDKNHIHNHLIVNSVSFENGKKVHMSNKDLEQLKGYSNFLCNHFNLQTTQIKKSNIKDISQNEYAVASRGESWKFQLIKDIDISMVMSKNKNDFIKNMKNQGYDVIWTDARKYITYITPDGNRCRDRSLHNENYLKENMEKHFESSNIKAYRDNTEIPDKQIENSKIENDTNTNCARFTSNTALDKIVALSYLLQNKRYNQDNSIRTIRGFRSFSKNAKKEWLNKHHYSSSFNWDDELEM